MSSYCFKCKKKTESKNPRAVRTRNRRLMLLLKCEIWDSKKSKFIREQEVSELLSTLEIRSLLRTVFFYFRSISKLIQVIKWMK